jgi:transposase-like protein
VAKRAYTDEDRERARVAWEASGRSVRGAARTSGIPVATIQAWIAGWENPPPAPLAPPEVYEAVYETIRTDKKAEIIEAAWALAKAAFDEAQLKLPDASAKDAATVAGIAVDKAQLLSGGATDRVDVRAILAQLPAPARAAVVALLADDTDA